MYSEDLTMVSVNKSHFGITNNPMNEPREIGCYSIDAEKRQHFDRSQMKYFIRRDSRNLHLDLNIGYENDIRKSFIREEKMENLLRWIAHTKFEPLQEYSPNFVCTRSAIKALLCTPFLRERSDHWIICASKLDNVIYLKVVDTDSEIQRKENATEEEKRMSAWGFKFEQYMMSDRPYGVPDISSTTHQTEEFYIVATNRIGRHKLMIEAEVDGVNPFCSVPPGSGDPSCYVELKTSKLVKQIGSSHQIRNSKFLRWWAQSVVTGINDIIYGLTDDNIVKSIQTLNTRELPFMCAATWSPRISFNFCNSFLNHLSGTLSENDPSITYKCEYYGESIVYVYRLRNPKDRFQVIPDWYVEEMRNK